MQEQALALSFRQCADGEARGDAFAREQVGEKQRSINSVARPGRVRSAGPAQNAGIRFVPDAVPNEEKDRLDVGTERLGFGIDIGSQRLGFGIDAPLDGIDTGGYLLSPFQEFQRVQLFVGRICRGSRIRWHGRCLRR